MASSSSSSPSKDVVDDKKKIKKKIKQVQKGQWLRAAILGANDGLLSTTSLMLGVGAAKEDHIFMVLSGVAGAIAGSCSMALGEFVSVSTQRDIENITYDHSKTDEDNNTIFEIISSETAKVGDDDNDQLKVEKLSPYVVKARSPIMKVMAMDGNVLPNPYKAAGASGLAFICGSIIPLVPATFIVQNLARNIVVVVAASIALALFGGSGAYLGGSPVKISAVRVLLGGWITMGLTYGLLKSLDKFQDRHDSD